MSEVLPPKPATLKKYGLSIEDWRVLLAQQGGACFVCENVPPRGRLCIDHRHVKGWKKMSPDRRRQYVRGLLCWVCNHYYLGRGITVAKARRVVEYLSR